MRYLIPLLLIPALLLSCTPSESAQEDSWQLVWSDEFDYNGLPNAEKWSYDIGYIANNEKQYYTEARLENARVEDGHLIIEAKKESDDDDVWPFDKPHYLLLNLAIGGNWGGTEGIDDSLFPHQFVVDYVRIYQEND